MVSNLYDTTSRSKRRQWLVALACVALATSACDTQPPTTQPPSGQPTISQAPTGATATVEVSPEAVLLTSSAPTKTLTATPRAEDGSAVAATVTWTSSNPAVATVDASGAVTATAAVGTALITATVGGVASPPTYATVAQPVAGAILITDAQIASGPTVVEPAADRDYEVVLSGVAGLTTGAIVINTESRSVAGRVVSATAEGADQRVRLSMVPLIEMFTAIELKDTVDLSTVQLEIPDALAATYDVVQTGSKYVFSPKAASAGGAMLASWAGPGGATGTSVANLEGHPFGPIVPFDECELEAGGGSGSPVPLALSVPPAFSVETSGTVTREATTAGTTIALDASPTFGIEVALELKAAIEAKASCKLAIAEATYRAPGLLGILFGGDIEFSIGVEIGGSATLAEAKLGVKAELATTLGLTVRCPATGDCGLSGRSSATGAFKPEVTVPNLNQARIEPSIKAFGSIEVDAGNADVEALQFEAMEAEAGLELGASLAFEGLQIDNTDAEDGRSKYELALKAEVGPGLKMGEFLEYLGIDSIVPLKLEFEAPLGSSPKGSVRADKARYLPGDTVKVKVTLEPESTVFPAAIGPYNVDKVFILRRDGLGTDVLAEAEPRQDGQNVFEFEFESPGLINAEELFGFVRPRLLPLDPPKFEIGMASVPILYTFDADFEGWRTFGRGPRSETKEWGEVTWRTDDGGCVRLSGARGDGPQNSSFFRDLQLPADARTLDFRVSADFGHAVSDSQLTVRIGPAGQAAATVLLREVYENRTGELKWFEVHLDISQFAGQNVRLVFDQRDDGDHEHEHIYLDDIGIGTEGPQ